MRNFICLVLCASCIGAPVLLFPGDDYSRKIKGDETLIVPGIGAEKLLLGEQEGSVEKTYLNREYDQSQCGRKDLFSDVFMVSSDFRIDFDKIHHYKDNGVSLFFLSSALVAVSGHAGARVTADAVSLSKGAEFFIFSYGNSGLTVLKRGKNALYVYKERGICVVDDGGDDSIDLYIIFKAPEQMAPQNH